MKTLSVYGLRVAVKRPINKYVRWTAYVGVDEGKVDHVVHFTEYKELFPSIRELVRSVREIREWEELPVPSTIVEAERRIRRRYATVA